METNRIEIILGPPKYEMDKIYKAGSGKDVEFDVNYVYNRRPSINILKILAVEEKQVKMLAEIYAGYFMYYQGYSNEKNVEKMKLIKVNIFYSTNTRKGYIEKIPDDKEMVSLNTKKDNNEPRVCPRCHGKKVDPHHYQDDCQRCGGTGKVYGNESDFTPYPFVD